jgi:hypothetical protein
LCIELFEQNKELINIIHFVNENNYDDLTDGQKIIILETLVNIILMKSHKYINWAKSQFKNVKTIQDYKINIKDLKIEIDINKWDIKESENEIKLYLEQISSSESITNKQLENKDNTQNKSQNNDKSDDSDKLDVPLSELEIKNIQKEIVKRKRKI